MKESTAIHDYLKFKKEYNIQKSIREAISYKENKFSKWIAYIVLATTLIFFLALGVNVIKTRDETTLSFYNTWYIKGLVINFLIMYTLNVFEILLLYLQIKRSVNNYKQNVFSFLYSSINWNSLSIRGYWYEIVAAKYTFVSDESIDFNYNLIHEELQYKEKPNFYLTSNNISIWFSIITPMFGVILYFIDIKELFGKDWLVVGKLLLVSLLTISPIISLLYSTLKDKFREKKNEHQSMQDYVIIMKYILEKRKLIQNQKSDKDLIKKIFRQMARR